MKFLCDRCKTRYSIGDERVRGKILKIRCKNCANVITVREGMTDADASGAAPRRTKTTTAAPIAEQPAAPGNGASALGAAFASAMTKPPPALDEEWYVSIDGEQSGPFSLAEAQRWVATKAFDADLHCWSEGFDDWLPVDKVSHFRGLRKKPPPPPAPPPLPPSRPGLGSAGGRAITAAPSRAVQAAAMTQQQPEEEPKPLFAATMASLERSASSISPPAAIAANGANGGALRVEARAAGSVANGTAARPAMQVPSIPSALPAIKPSPTVKGVGLRPVVAPVKPPLGFDASDGAATQIESPAFPNDDQPTMRPESSPNGEAFVAALAAEKPKRALSSLLEGMESKPDPRGQTGPNDAFFDRAKAEAPAANDDPPADDLEIGEVSRVVNLADLARSKPVAKEKSAHNRTGSVQKLTGAVPKINGASLSGKLNATQPVALIDAVDVVPTGQLAELPLAPIAPIASSHRRGMIALMIGALLLLGAAVVVVVFVVNSRNEVTSLGSDYDYNGQRPEDPIHRPGDPPIAGSNEPPQNPFLPPKPRPRPNPNPNPGSAKPPDPPPLGNSIKGDEVETMARNTNNTTVACFRRADKGADAIRLADIKKISVVFHINPDGIVAGNSIKLSENGSETLTACIQRMISGWKFRANAGGDFKFVFAKPE